MAAGRSLVSEGQMKLAGWALIVAGIACTLGTWSSQFERPRREWDLGLVAMCVAYVGVVLVIAHSFRKRTS